MATMKISEARDNLPRVIELAQKEAVILERYGHPAVVLVSPERYDELMSAFEDAEDIAAVDAALAEDAPSIPWEEIKAEFGWT
jgi:antitoxin Phd